MGYWDDPGRLLALIEQHLAWYPRMQARDVYKLLYQGILGPEHLLSSPEVFASRLRVEFSTLDACPGERLYDPVHPDSMLVRLNFRPYKTLSGDPDLLIAACLEAGSQTWGSTEDLRQAWAAFTVLCQERTWDGLPLADVLALTGLLEDGGYPAVHHSPVYRETYCPSYRLVAGSFQTSFPEV